MSQPLLSSMLLSSQRECLLLLRTGLGNFVEFDQAMVLLYQIVLNGWSCFQATHPVEKERGLTFISGT